MMSFHAFCVYFLAFWGRHGRDGERLAQCFAHDCAGRHALGNGRRFGRPATTLAPQNVSFPTCRLLLGWQQTRGLKNCLPQRRVGSRMGRQMGILV
jgi:hypothetical protein